MIDEILKEVKELNDKIKEKNDSVINEDGDDNENCAETGDLFED